MTRVERPRPLGARLDSVVLDAADPGRLARFYAALLDRPITRVDGRWYDIRLDGRLRLCIQHSPEHRPPSWPHGDIPQQVHLDLAVDGDLDDAEARAVALGAVAIGHPTADDPRRASFRTLRDPAGHPFCLEASGWGARTGKPDR